MEILCRSPPERVEPFSSDHGLIAFRELLYKFIAPGGFGCCDDFLIRGSPASKAYIFHHRIPKQNHILKYHGIIF